MATSSTDKAERHGRPAIRPLAIGLADHRACGDCDRDPALVGTPLAWWLARSKAWWTEAVATVVALPLVLPPTVLGFYMLVALGPNGPGGLIASLWGGARCPSPSGAWSVGSVFYSLPFVLQPIHNA